MGLRLSETEVKWAFLPTLRQVQEWRARMFILHMMPSENNWIQTAFNTASNAAFSHFYPP
ncbi:hypothetical protein C7N83_02745 [Neisseria iguanae]|uniref:Uncharacterized protein n=1 Tax=Neisseria iguanae TaxID=90242 RepID=A0A2P7U2C1_9NEIS|nr:hypothetical protein C7N83_02745 [Neisseria iguanae]